MGSETGTRTVLCANTNRVLVSVRGFRFFRSQISSSRCRCAGGDRSVPSLLACRWRQWIARPENRGRGRSFHTKNDEALGRSVAGIALGSLSVGPAEADCQDVALDPVDAFPFRVVSRPGRHVDRARFHLRVQSVKHPAEVIYRILRATSQRGQVDRRVGDRDNQSRQGVALAFARNRPGQIKYFPLAADTRGIPVRSRPGLRFVFWGAKPRGLGPRRLRLIQCELPEPRRGHAAGEGADEGQQVTNGLRQIHFTI